MLLDLFADRAALPVLEPADGDRVRPGAIYLAPRDHHLLVIDEAFRLSRGARQHFTRPAIDPTFATVASSYGERAVAVVLTGSGHDGVAGAIAIQSAGGLVLTQRPAEAQHPSMPAHVVMHDHVDALLALDELPRTIGSLARGEAIRMRPVALRGFA
jgi:two-component system chemotaxis response regulator CheB